MGMTSIGKHTHFITLKDVNEIQLTANFKREEKAIAPKVVRYQDINKRASNESLYL